MLPLAGSGQAAMAAMAPSYYPPALTGLRGSHPGSNIHAHGRALEDRTDWGPTTQLNEEYDLIVVGGGLSGLAAAYYYQQEHGTDKKILVLDNHDDFGGGTPSGPSIRSMVKRSFPTVVPNRSSNQSMPVAPSTGCWRTLA